MEKSKKRASNPGNTVQSRENQLISLAVDIAEERMRNGTASSQLITHYLKLGTVREKLEQEKIRQENELLKAKTKAIESSEKLEKLYLEAIEAMGLYSGETKDD